MLSQNLSAAETDVILMYLRPDDAFQHIASFFSSLENLLSNFTLNDTTTSPPTPPFKHHKELSSFSFLKNVRVCVCVYE